MTPIQQRKRVVTAGIFGMFGSWTLAVMSLEAVILLAFVVGQKWFPPVMIGICLVAAYLRLGNRSPLPRYSRVALAVSSALLISAFIMVGILWVGDSWEPAWLKPQPRNSSIPYIAILIVAPVMAMTSFWMRWCYSKSALREKYRMKMGAYAEADFLEKLYVQESAVQLETLFVISACVGIADWIYYFKYYINVNINSPDTFFFVVLPSVLLAVSLVVFLRRYRGMWNYYCLNEDLDRENGYRTDVRYLVVAGDHLYLENNGTHADTPVKCRLPFTTTVDEFTAHDNFVRIAGITPKKIKFAYVTENSVTLSNTFHYMCFFDEESQLDNIKVKGAFYSLDQLWRMVKSREVAPELEAELRRIYTVAVTWKTYTPAGMRLYAIRNYRPTFRLRDMIKWDVDYNDRNWLAVAADNQDKPLWRLRKFLHRFVNGI